MGPGFESLMVHQWPVGQEAKTPPSHGGIMGSIPVRVTIWFQEALLLKYIAEPVFMATRFHPFPFRTRKLSSFASKILGWKRPGKIDRCRHLQYSSIAQSVEHLTVNQGVTGSSPVGGAISYAQNR